MARFILSIAAVALLLFARPAAAGNVSLEEALGEKILGNSDAPITMIDYSSLTCPHCAAFQKETFPKIKKAYIDTGKVKLIYRDFPIGALALAAAMVARCSGERKYFGMLDILFRSQDKWANSQDPLGEIERISRFAGLSKDDVGACLKNTDLMKGIQKVAKEATDKFGIDSTPSFVINGKMFPGNQPYENFRKIFEAALQN